jgi:hypothetical protein
MSSDLVQIRPHRSHQDASSPPLLASFWLVPSLRARRRGEDWGGDRENSRRSFWRSASHLTPAGLRLIPAPVGIPFRWVIESAVAAVFEVAIDCTDGRGARREPRFCPTDGHVSRPCRLRGEPHRGRSPFRARPHHRRSCLRSGGGQARRPGFRPPAQPSRAGGFLSPRRAVDAPRTRVRR